jgi:hypothetical protein
MASIDYLSVVASWMMLLLFDLCFWMIFGTFNYGPYLCLNLDCKILNNALEMFLDCVMLNLRYFGTN